ncbi:MAG: hypothetical protein ACRD2T_10595, partial [Thermoanaerobaculia bacterium]
GMVQLLDLWLPILLSAVLVFIVSSVIHMCLPFHKSDCKKLPGEDKLLEAMRAQGVEPGHYVFPRADSMKDMGSPEMVEKCNRGPVGVITVMPNGPFTMGPSLVLWFLYSLLIGVFTAYIASIGLPRGAAAMEVFRLVGSTAILGYAFNSVPESIWKGLSWKLTAKFLLDGIAYGLATAATFTWLWPAA